MLDPHKDEPGGTGLGLDRSQSISLEAPTRYNIRECRPRVCCS